MNKKFINLGSYDFQMDGWLNLDKRISHYSAKQKRIDINHNLMSFDNIALPDNSLKIAYTSHTIEHISDCYVIHLFKEVYRLLEDGGVFRITCPDIEKCYNAYAEGDEEYISKWLLNPAGWERFRSFGIGERFLFIFASYLSPYRNNISNFNHIKKYNEEEISGVFKEKDMSEALTFFTDICQKYASRLQALHPGEHIGWWSFDKLKKELIEIGFKNIEAYEYNESPTPELSGFDYHSHGNREQHEYSLFLECKK